MGNIKNDIEISSLLDYQSIQDFLVDLFQPSKNKLKKYFDKKFLAKSLKAKQTIFLPIDFVNDGEINPVYCGPEIEILFEDQYYLVMNKPHQIFVHPLTYNESDNCLSYMRAKNISGLSVNRESFDRGLLYRLDYETSGVLIYLKNQEIYHELREHFHEIAKEKIYWAKVSGDFDQEGEVVHFLRASEKGGMKMQAHKVAVPNSEQANLKVSKLNYDSIKDESLVEVSLKTGHRHQIRVQLAALGFPLIGDSLYGGKPGERLFLHATKYSIIYQGKSHEFISKPHNF